MENIGCTWTDFKVKPLPVVEPDASEARVVFIDDLARAAREGVRGEFAENMPHVRTRLNEDAPATLPDLSDREWRAGKIRWSRVRIYENATGKQ